MKLQLFNIFRKYLFNYFKIEEQLNVENIFSLKNINQDAIFIASYPKSGVTWMQNMLIGLIYGIDIENFSYDFLSLLSPDMHSSKYYVKTGLPTVVKSHSLPERKMKKVIHLIRDGRDVMGSYFAMQKNRGLNTSLTEMIIHKKGLFPCDWKTHCQKWIENPFQADIHRVFYENLKSDPAREISKIADFLKIQITSSRLNNIIFQSNFENMQRREKESGWKNGVRFPQGAFVRRGEVGSFRNEIPVELIEYFQKDNYEILNKFGYM